MEDHVDSAAWRFVTGRYVRAGTGAPGPDRRM